MSLRRKLDALDRALASNPGGIDAAERAVAASMSPRRMAILKGFLQLACRMEATEAYLFHDAAERYGATRAELDAAIGEMLDEGTLRATVIEGRDFQFGEAVRGRTWPGLVRTAGPAPKSPKRKRAAR